MLNRTLVQCISQVALTVRPESLASVVAALRAGSLSVESASVGSLVALAGGAQACPADLAADLLRGWRALGATALPPVALALALEAAAATSSKARAEAPHLDLIWTGDPAVPAQDFLLTRSVIHDMLGGARRRVLVMGYDLRDAAGDVIEAVRKARGRSCEIVIALHDNQQNHARVLNLWPGMVGDPMVRLLAWRGRPEYPIASLHAKLLAVDDDDVLLTSANLTRNGLEANLELGVRIRGRVASRVIRHVARLEEACVLIPYSATHEE